MTPALAQEFNIDIGPSGSSVPSGGYGAAANQAGFWNLAVGLLLNAKDVNGVTTAVSINVDGSKHSLPISGATGDEAILMEDEASASAFSTSDIQVAGCNPGQYRVYLYGWAGNQYGDFQSVYDFYDPQTGAKTRKVIDYDAAWPGQQVLGETYTTYDFAITAPNQTFMVVYYGQGVGEETYTSVINGLQIVQIPAPPVSVLAGLGAFAMLRRGR